MLPSSAVELVNTFLAVQLQHSDGVFWSSARNIIYACAKLIAHEEIIFTQHFSLLPADLDISASRELLQQLRQHEHRQPRHAI